MAIGERVELVLFGLEVVLFTFGLIGRSLLAPARPIAEHHRISHEDSCRRMRCEG